MAVLILGGTQEARALKEQLGDSAILSLARDGGFGGPDGLARYVAEHEIEKILDATHPFATRISASARAAGVPYLRLERPPFTADATYVNSLKKLDLPTDARVFLTTGHAEIEALSHHPAFFLVRALTPPPTLPPRHELILAKGPFTLENELRLIDTHRLTHLVSKDSGGPDAKLKAAAERGLEIILVKRPPKPGPSVATVEEALRWAQRASSSTSPRRN
jgi:precorrin-6A/cobalt-precorrin-6A reductase